jgi:hypothetical protein
MHHALGLARIALLVALGVLPSREAIAQSAEASAAILEKDARALYAHGKFDEARLKLVVACKILKHDDCIQELALAEYAAGYYTHSMNDIDGLLTRGAFGADPLREAQFRKLRQTAFERTTRNHEPAHGRGLLLRGMGFIGFVALGFGIGFALGSQGAANAVTAYRMTDAHPCSDLSSPTCAVYRGKVDSTNTQAAAAIVSYIVAGSVTLASQIITNVFLLLNELKPPSERTRTTLRPTLGPGFAGMVFQQRF